MYPLEGVGVGKGHSQIVIPARHGLTAPVDLQSDEPAGENHQAEDHAACSNGAPVTAEATEGSVLHIGGEAAHSTTQGSGRHVTRQHASARQTQRRTRKRKTLSILRESGSVTVHVTK